MKQHLIKIDEKVRTESQAAIMGSGKDKKVALKFTIDYRHPVKNGIMNRAEFYSLVSLQCKIQVFFCLRFYWKLALQKCQKLRFCLFWDSENEQKHIFRLSELAENRTLTIIEDLKWQFRWKLVLQNCLILQIDENIGATMGSDKGKKATMVRFSRFFTVWNLENFTHTWNLWCFDFKWIFTIF